jgi:phage FluMu protein Com
MAEMKVFRCNVCNNTLESWSDGNPYYLDSSGEKQYAYHPDHDKLSRCIGNDTPHLCLSCGNEFMIDSLSPITQCRKCNSEDISETFSLEEKTCPVCNKGIFILDPTQHAIS